ncbi:hypothetical protein GGR56DRAFT_343937 [Xylariaceae sp. FL0804]|nr:hypothetical protein GGR56DRAFT_343937 [Xylariaceae sp. FL0804]
MVGLQLVPPIILPGLLTSWNWASRGRLTTYMRTRLPLQPAGHSKSSLELADTLEYGVRNVPRPSTVGRRTAMSGFYSRNDTPGAFCHILIRRRVQGRPLRFASDTQATSYHGIVADLAYLGSLRGTRGEVTVKWVAERLKDDNQHRDSALCYATPCFMLR